MKQILLIIAVVALVGCVGPNLFPPPVAPLTYQKSAEVIQLEIRKAAKNSAGDLTKADLNKVEFLDLSRKGITDVRALAGLTQLKTLWLDNNHIIDIGPLASLKNLEELVIEDNPNLTLTKAEINQFQKAMPNCKITHNAPIILTITESAMLIETVIRKKLNKPTSKLNKADLEQVKELRPDPTRGARVESLRNLPELLRNLPNLNERLQKEKLRLQKVGAFNPLEAARNLQTLKESESLKEAKESLVLIQQAFSHCNEKITDLSYMGRLPNIVILDLSGNRVTEFAPLKGLKKLEWLSLSNSQLTDVKGLKNLTQLTTLLLLNNPDLTKAQIDQLQKALPKCRIEHNAKK